MNLLDQGISSLAIKKVFSTKDENKGRTHEQPKPSKQGVPGGKRRAARDHSHTQERAPRNRELRPRTEKNTIRPHGRDNARKCQLSRVPNKDERHHKETLRVQRSQSSSVSEGMRSNSATDQLDHRSLEKNHVNVCSRLVERGECGDLIRKEGTGSKRLDRFLCI